MAVTNTPDKSEMTAGDVTDDMLNAGQERLCQLRCRTSFDDDLQAEIFAAMFNARSRSPADQVPDMEEWLMGLVEPVTKAVLFDDCGNTVDWKDNTNIGIAVVNAIRPHLTALQAVRGEVGEVVCVRHEPYHGRCVHCDVAIKDGKPVLAALQAVPAASEVGWQPIESAPKDGSYIIAAKFGRSQELAWVKHSRWITAGEIADLEGGEPDEYDPGWTDGNDDSEPCFPTNWMPLEPPALKASGEE